MLDGLPHTLDLIIVLAGALAAGFVSGFAGFGTGLVSAGLWFHALPAMFVPPLVALASVAGQLVGFVSVRKSFDWPQALPYLIGGVIGVPFGVWALSQASPDFLRLVVGVFLVAYAVFQLTFAGRMTIGDAGGKAADGCVGVSGGFLGGFAGLSGVPPLVWLQLRNTGTSAQQRAIYQPFNLIVLTLASLGMAIGGQITLTVVKIAALCLPVTLIGAWLGTRAYKRISEQGFRLVVLMLLLASGLILMGQTFAG